MILKKGEKVRVIDDSIFPEHIQVGVTGYVVEKEFKKGGITRIAFYPGGKRFDFEIENSTEIEDYLLKIDK
jgi:hypothetical protein